MRNPVVSVIIPTYNRERLLPRALDSVLAQTFDDFEALVVDDGSTDGTADVMREYESRDSRVCYLRQLQNAGVSAARNRGLREARGELIAFLDSDDEWFRQKLARQVDRFRELPERVGLLYVGVENQRANGDREVVTPRHRGDLYATLLRRNVLHGTSGIMLRRTAAERAGFFDVDIPAIEDYDYWLRVARDYEVEFVVEPLIRYHDPDTGVRKSLHHQDNMDARAYLYRKYRADMRRAGVAHAFLLESARRFLEAPTPDRKAARLLAWRAALERPVARGPYRMIWRTMRAPRGTGLQ